jgi:excinuclease ABC subunit C
VLDELLGVGPTRKRALLRVFGSTRQLKKATVDEIAAVPGISRALAERIHEGLNA